MKKDARLLYLKTALIGIALIILGRITAEFRVIAATDISYPEAVYQMLVYLSEILTSARIIFGYAAIVYCTYKFKGREIALTFLIVCATVILDYTVRFLIDFYSGAITDMLSSTVMYLTTEFVYEAVFASLVLIVALLMKKKFDSAENRNKASFSSSRAVSYSALLLMASKLIIEVIYLIDFLTKYVGITKDEVVSIFGEFSKILIIHGLLAVILGNLFLGIFEKRKKKLRI